MSEQCPTCGPMPTEPHPRLPVIRCANCKEHLRKEGIRSALVILFKPTGKYYTEEEWRIPTQEEIDAASPPQPSPFSKGKISAAYPFMPYCLRFSPDFRRISGGAVLVPTQEPWGYPHLIPGVSEDE